MTKLSASQRQCLERMGMDTWLSTRLQASGGHTRTVAAAVRAPAPRPADTPRTTGHTATDAAAEVPSSRRVDTHTALSKLATEVEACRQCALGTTRTHSVFARGATDAACMVVGEAPGAEEDRRGEPFVGRAGKLLDNMLAAIGLTNNHVYIANVIKCRPPENRNPQAEEIAACSGYLQRQIELVAPRLILAVGRIAAHRLLQTDAPLSKLRGRIHRHPGGNLPLLVCYHPAYLLRSPSRKADAWRDLLMVRRLLNSGDVPAASA